MPKHLVRLGELASGGDVAHYVFGSLAARQQG